MAALAFTRPSTEFRVETTGWFSPVGQMVRYPSGPGGTAVTFSEKAAAVERSSVGQALPCLAACGRLKVSKVPPGIGPPPPYCVRVSTNRQGGTATNCNAVAAPPPTTETVASEARQRTATQWQRLRQPPKRWRPSNSKRKPGW